MPDEKKDEKKEEKKIDTKDRDKRFMYTETDVKYILSKKK